MPFLDPSPISGFTNFLNYLKKDFHAPRPPDSEYAVKPAAHHTCHFSGIHSLAAILAACRCFGQIFFQGCAVHFSDGDWHGASKTENHFEIGDPQLKSRHRGNPAACRCFEQIFFEGCAVHFSDAH